MLIETNDKQSVDIDLLTNSEYGTIDFETIDKYLKANSSCGDTMDSKIVGFGRSHFIGESKDHSVRLDLFYTDSFIRGLLKPDGIRFAHMDEIVATKIEIVSWGAQTKDFWGFALASGALWQRLDAEFSLCEALSVWPS